MRRPDASDPFDRIPKFELHEGIESTWLDDLDRRALRAEFDGT